MTIETVIFYLFPAIVAFAAASDLLTMTISNRLCLVLAVLFVPVAVFAGLPAAVMGWQALYACGILAVGIALFGFGIIGGGDAKLAAAIALWLDPSQLLYWAMLFGVIGGAMTLVIIVGRRFPLPFALQGQAWIARLHHHESGVPYGVALAAGAMMVYPQTVLVSALLGSPLRF